MQMKFGFWSVTWFLPTPVEVILLLRIGDFLYSAETNFCDCERFVFEHGINLCDFQQVAFFWNVVPFFKEITQHGNQLLYYNCVLLGCGYLMVIPLPGVQLLAAQREKIREKRCAERCLLLTPSFSVLYLAPLFFALRPNSMNGWKRLIVVIFTGLILILSFSWKFGKGTELLDGIDRKWSCPFYQVRCLLH